MRQGKNNNNGHSHSKREEREAHSSPWIIVMLKSTWTQVVRFPYYSAGNVIVLLPQSLLTHCSWELLVPSSGPWRYPKVLLSFPWHKTQVYGCCFLCLVSDCINFGAQNFILFCIAPSVLVQTGDTFANTIPFKFCIFSMHQITNSFH